MNLRDAGRMLRRYWISIVACTLAGLAIAAWVLLDHRPSYASSVTLTVAVSPEGTSPDDLSNAALYAETEIAKLSSLAVQGVILDPVVERLGLGVASESVVPMLSFDSEGSEMELTVVSGDAATSARLAQEIGGELVANLATRAPKDEGGAPTVVASIITPAVESDEPINDDIDLTLLVGALVGLAAGIVQAAIRAALDTKIHTEADVRRAAGRDVVARTPLDKRLAKGQLAVTGDPHSPLAEAFRRLRTNLLYAGSRTSLSTLVVTSAVVGEGKTTTAVGLAHALAEGGASVLLVDADLRAPQVAQALGIEPGPGLVSILSGERSLGDAVRRVGDSGLDVLADADVPANPAELLGSPAMKLLLAQAGKSYDHVVFDTPPVLPVTDATLLAAQCQGVLVVAGSETVTATQLQQALAALERVSASILGVVLNRVRLSRGDGMALPRRATTTPSGMDAAPAPARGALPTRAIAPGDVLADR